MIKKKAKSKKAAKKVSKKRTPRKQLDPAKVRQEIAGMVKSGAKKITQAVISHAYNGELAPAKYLLEMAGVFPAMTDGSEASAEEDSLAKTLLDRLNIPDEPVVHDLYEKDEDVMVIPARSSKESATEQSENSEEAPKTLVGIE